MYITYFVWCPNRTAVIKPWLHWYWQRSNNRQEIHNTQNNWP